MPRITPSRIAKVLLLPWLAMIGVWLFLPSPPRTTPVTDFQSNQNTLRSGKTLTTVVKWDAELNRKHRGSIGECSAVILDWRLSSNDQLSLSIGGWTANLAKTLKSTYTTSFSDGTSTFQPTVSDPYTLRVPAGDTDHIYNMPWFAWSDKIMFHHEFHGFDAEIVLRLVVPEPGMVQIWKAAAVDDALGWSADQKSRLVIVRKLQGESRMYGMLAEFKIPVTADGNIDGGAAAIKNVDVYVPKGEQPSRTYPLRRSLIFPLAPVIMVVFFLLSLLWSPIAWAASWIGPILTVFGAISIGLWIRAGRPPMREFWIVCWLPGLRTGEARNSRVWGPAGPVTRHARDGSFGSEEVSVGLQRPSNAKIGYGGRGWK